jgi:energy-coupling factor transporter ATP-binding protein EcfA2
MRPALLLMDEPTAALDSARRGELATTVRKLSADGTTVMIATHDAEFARACVDRVLLLDRGQVVREGRPDVVLS